MPIVSTISANGLKVQHVTIHLRCEIFVIVVRIGIILRTPGRNYAGQGPRQSSLRLLKLLKIAIKQLVHRHRCGNGVRRFGLIVAIVIFPVPINCCCTHQLGRQRHWDWRKLIERRGVCNAIDQPCHDRCDRFGAGN